MSWDGGNREGPPPPPPGTIMEMACEADYMRGTHIPPRGWRYENPLSFLSAQSQSKEMEEEDRRKESQKEGGKKENPSSGSRDPMPKNRHDDIRKKGPDPFTLQVAVPPPPAPWAQEEREWTRPSKGKGDSHGSEAPVHASNARRGGRGSQWARTSQKGGRGAPWEVPSWKRREVIDL